MKSKLLLCIGLTYLLTTSLALALPGLGGRNIACQLPPMFIKIINASDKRVKADLSTNSPTYAYIGTQGFYHVIQEKPIEYAMKSDALYAFLTNQTLEVFWIVNGKVLHKAFPQHEVQDIIKLLASEKKWSDNRNLIKMIVEKYGCKRATGAGIVYFGGESLDEDYSLSLEEADTKKWFFQGNIKRNAVVTITTRTANNKLDEYLDVKVSKGPSCEE